VRFVARLLQAASFFISAPSRSIAETSDAAQKKVLIIASKQVNDCDLFERNRTSLAFSLIRRA
jgi:hypothetical protein